MVKELITIDNILLDSINHTTPMMLLSASMHTLYLNTKALEYVFKHNSDISNQYKTVENYIAETKGQLQEGLQMTPALKTVKLQIITMSIEINRYLTNLFNTANSRGLLFMYDAGLNKGSEVLLTKYFETHTGTRKNRRRLSVFQPEDVDKLEPYKEPEHYKPVYYGHIKVVSDGSNRGIDRLSEHSLSM